MENEITGNTFSDTVEDTAPDTTSAPKDANAELRAAYDRLKSENSTLRAAAMRAELREIGLSPDEGLGVAIVESYKGDITAEAIGQYAFEKYKHQAAQAPVPPAVETGERLDRLAAAGQPVTPPPTPDAIQEAEGRLVSEDATRGDAIASATLKAQRLQEQYRQGLIR